MKVLVTGANGYLGKGIVQHLAGAGAEVIAADIAVDPASDGVTVKECDLFEIEDPYHFFGEPDVLLHLAWRAGFQHNADSHIADLPKHHTFLKKMFESGVKRVAVMGSMHEVGFFEGSIKEDTPCNPMNLYGIGKNALREIVEFLSDSYKVPFQWLRGFYIVSNAVNGSSIFSKIAAADQKGQKTFPFTMGQNQYDFLDYEEFCSQVSAVVLQEKIDGIINICSGRPEKLADRVEKYIADNGFSIRLEYGAYPDRPYDSKAIWGDDTKIRQIMGECAE